MAMKNASTPEPSRRSRQRGRSVFAVSGVVLAVLLAMAGPGAHAAGFGEVQVASQLGERLYARIPLVGEGAAEVTTECVRLIPDSVLQDAPALANARLGIDRKSSPPAVVVTTPAPVAEPAVRFVLEMGCGNRLRREFVLLIDPPDLPSTQTATLPPLRRAPSRAKNRAGAAAPPAPLRRFRRRRLLRMGQRWRPSLRAPPRRHRARSRPSRVRSPWPSRRELHSPNPLPLRHPRPVRRKSPSHRQRIASCSPTPIRPPRPSRRPNRRRRTPRAMRARKR